MPSELKPVPRETPWAKENRQLRQRDNYARVVPIEFPEKGDVWERLPGETQKAWLAFKLYRDLPSETRTIADAEEQYRAKLGKPVKVRDRSGGSGQFWKWKKQYRWEERITAYDNFMDAVRVKRVKNRILRSAERHADEMAAASEVLAHPINKYKQRLAEVVAGMREDTLDKLTDEELLKLGRHTAAILADIQKAERDALGVQIGEDRPTVNVTARAEALRKVMANPELIGVMEKVSFELQVNEQVEDSG